MKRVLTIVSAVFLAGCEAAPTAPTPDVPISISRNPTAPVGSQADVVAADLAGSWFVREGRADHWPVTVGGADFERDGAAIVVPVIGGTCDDTGLCIEVQQDIRYSPSAAGRWVSDDPNLSAQAGLPSEIWVYWMDFDARTMAIGNPNGNSVAIMDKNATGGRDRITAARDILDWYGYSTDGLIEVVR